ncbi:NUDIX hydrolase [Candidatus Woesebacteria bacterium]|nr:NUDIX hydrolase [Candidatus Woesebacteria bacterium]MCD8507339.1 NUDIX hydrolase [Candidatus Woesebacteria bacterium]MCD8527586.1 NUDIX hydrolase [Candidatus Woesebacteria bacterium]MCD8546442.1 NUDIX hydrolase [Candidatus Woesebacteria bacterium]
MFRLLRRNSIYSDQWLEFYQDEVVFPDGTKGTYAWAARKNGVGVVVITADQKIVLNREYRYVIDAYSWEVPGGGIDAGESLTLAAQRELKEETGIFVAEEDLVLLGEFYPLNSFNTEKVSVFLAQVNTVQLHAEGTEQGESIVEQRLVSFDEALEMIDSGQMSDALSANAVQMAVRRVGKNTLINRV